MAYLCEIMLQKGKLLLYLKMCQMQHSVMRHNANQKNLNATMVKSYHKLCENNYHSSHPSMLSNHQIINAVNVLVCSD
jgi:hypothetical protein